ncbi:tyrosine--tRNA ligase [Candidatus Adlerbacteria bacterium RIFCSPHIGHO2_01_FULL_54_23]|uniref:Tyrosine--tRNA ligase n=3 Tax=Candidatus Adleribacteriota TaxID=1752736 RepID=A0A1F4XYV6_9BACT|nr:MAG: Tyrosine-tRNA ligase [Candidatus Adlerbacteria bacterium GW2011_GWA1_54_10]KKW36264.1 MAG: Tyrosine-tRNA ligase [Candidatus Adlerbacteria bacterium GW2011_GWA2_54_12]KKW37794.1 MAG: Tyrosine-tRNA ligase [Candidatus Adlerbacteria bacterium GW2011_GWB1_54_7]OGC78816.1 MAG: tyrosine--tRNA ligase [Candidatus Adlerbacteria bacterium RIFCSPHIGHO2_01_FULL_54_23]OGC86890.1 MAG: tyrosine--tRNA ligase [Candidatus Adlerbacteria bacterium RIFCSPLOWO2_01_FULL_54_16]
MSIFSRRAEIVTDENKIDELLSRGVAEAIVRNDLRRKLLSGKRLRVKLGIDPTSPDLHIGRSIPLLKLRDFQTLGHKVVLIVGDFTAVIGDTSDKDAERPMLAREDIEKNKKTYYDQIGKLIDLSLAEFRYNSEWLAPLTYREIGEHADLFSVADFISRDNIASRLKAGKRVSLREVLYPLMQGYDSVAIKADVELGGTDQKFNLLAGRTLQEKYGQEPQNIVMNPLVEGLDGRKMSSSWGNVIPLTASPSDMYGKVMSMADAQVRTYFELCTRVPTGEIERIMEMHPKESKMSLAKEIVEMYHGKDAAEKAQSGFMQPGDAPEYKFLRGGKIRDIADTVGISVSELRRLVSAGAIEVVGGEKIENIDAGLKDCTLKIGKHRFLKITFE